VLVGSGSTVPAPLVNKWANAYNQHNPNVQMRYVASGAGEGLAAITHGSGDFAFGEMPLTSQQRSKAGSRRRDRNRSHLQHSRSSD